MASALTVVLLLAVLAIANAAIDGDLVTTLPGYGQLKTKHYSGLLPVDDAKSVFLHYWFVESSGTPSTDPVVVWLNGGPGCSSLEGFLFELGPLHFTGQKDASGLPTLYDNPYSWSQNANILFIESPAGVGFSYAVNGSTACSDEIASQNNYGFLLNWFAGFPEYVKSDFYITGESYAGIYIPTLADRIRLGNQGGQSAINLLGFAVGNACWGNQVGTCAFAWDSDVINTVFYYGHALFSQVSYEKVIVSCGNLTNPSPTDACENSIQNAWNEIDTINNVYDIYDTCPSPVSGQAHALKRLPQSRRSQRVGQASGCIEPSDFAGPYLNNAQVQQALHVTAANVTAWSVCNFAVNAGYDRSNPNLLPLYPTLIKNYRVLVYSGDTDGCVPETGSERWTYGLGIPVKDAWRPWMSSNDQVNGYVQTYDANDFTFATVKGAGHMVPQYQPAAAYDMFSRWVANKPL